jgi:hypothetical protein
MMPPAEASGYFDALHDFIRDRGSMDGLDSVLLGASQFAHFAGVHGLGERNQQLLDQIGLPDKLGGGRSRSPVVDPQSLEAVLVDREALVAQLLRPGGRAPRVEDARRRDDSGGFLVDRKDSGLLIDFCEVLGTTAGAVAGMAVGTFVAAKGGGVTGGTAAGAAAGKVVEGWGTDVCTYIYEVTTAPPMGPPAEAPGATPDGNGSTESGGAPSSGGSTSTAGGGASTPPVTQGGDNETTMPNPMDCGLPEIDIERALAVLAAAKMPAPTPEGEEGRSPWATGPLVKPLVELDTLIMPTFDVSGDEDRNPARVLDRRPGDPPKPTGARLTVSAAAAFVADRMQTVSTGPGRVRIDGLVRRDKAGNVTDTAIATATREAREALAVSLADRVSTMVRPRRRGRGGRQLQGQRRFPDEGRADHEEDEQQEHDVDQRREVDLGFLASPRGEVHAAPSPWCAAWSTSTSCIASCSMWTTSSSTRPRR